MKKIIALVLSVVMVVLALASCGGNATTGTTAGTKNTGTPAGTTTAAGTTGTNGTTAGTGRICRALCGKEGFYERALYSGNQREFAGRRAGDPFGAVFEGMPSALRLVSQPGKQAICAGAFF